MSASAAALATVAIVLIAASSPSWADCAADCSAAYRSCSGNPDTCLSQQGVCLSRCGLEAERHGAIAYSALKKVYGYSSDYGSSRPAADAAVANCRKENKGASDCKVLVTFRNACGALALGNNGAYGSAWGLSQREAANKALVECRPYGGTSCKIERQVCSGAR
jgi:serine/threonine-protein kinase